MKKTPTKVKETNQATEDKVNHSKYNMLIEESEIYLKVVIGSMIP